MRFREDTKVLDEDQLPTEEMVAFQTELYEFADANLEYNQIVRIKNPYLGIQATVTFSGSGKKGGIYRHMNVLEMQITNIIQEIKIAGL